MGSPSIIKLNISGHPTLFVSADRFGSGFKTERNVSVYRSDDNGVSWNQISWVKDQYWSNLFQRPSDPSLFLLGTSCDGPSPIKIARSRDNGVTWNESSILFGTKSGNLSFETGPTPTLFSKGRVYRAFERLRPPFSWGVDYEAVPPMLAVLYDHFAYFCFF